MASKAVLVTVCRKCGRYRADEGLSVDRLRELVPRCCPDAVQVEAMAHETAHGSLAEACGMVVYESPSVPIGAAVIANVYHWSGNGG